MNNWTGGVTVFKRPVSRVVAENDGDRKKGKFSGIRTAECATRLCSEKDLEKIHILALPEDADGCCKGSKQLPACGLCATFLRDPAARTTPERPRLSVLMFS